MFEGSGILESSEGKGGRGKDFVYVYDYAGSLFFFVFFAYQVRGKIKKDLLENVTTFESREQFSTCVDQLLASVDLCRINNLIDKAKGQQRGQTNKILTIFLIV